MQYYKIRDFEDDDKYSQYLVTSRECKKIIEMAIADFYGGDDDGNKIDADNVFEAIEQYLDMRDIEWKWITFTVVNF